MHTPASNVYQDIANDRGLIWHYTSWEGLIGILGPEGKVWATNAEYLNDTRELRCGLAKLAEYFSDHEPLQAYLQNNGWNREGSPQEVYVTSFSKAFDSLSQWRGYRAPFALGFRRSILERIADNYSFRLCDCVYETDKAGLDQLFDVDLRALNMSREAANARPGNPNAGKRYMQNDIPGVFFRRYAYAVQIKDDAFREEGEVRLFLQVPREGLAAKVSKLGQGLPPCRLEFRWSGVLQAPVPYIALPLSGGDHAHPVEQILVGPCAHPELAAASVERLLENLAVKPVGVCGSKVPYRSMNS